MIAASVQAEDPLVLRVGASRVDGLRLAGVDLGDDTAPMNAELVSWFVTPLL